jgi:SAM-dependent methyltransferase
MQPFLAARLYKRNEGAGMDERKRDEALGIVTVGTREWLGVNIQYHRYEATPYRALDVLCENYDFNGVDQVVDFGCGRGRVAFYLHDRFNLPVVGIEANRITFEEALANKDSYNLKAGDISAPVEFLCCLAQHYRIEEKDNCFYFFNPFTVQIFRKVVQNILFSFEKHGRTMDLILYYPDREYLDFLNTSTPFRRISDIMVSKGSNDKDKFVIYRLDNGGFKD